MTTPTPDHTTTTPAEGVTIHHGDCLDVLRAMPAESVHAVVTDPPYGLNFMGREWDNPGAAMLGQMATGKEQRGAFAYGGSHSRGYADNNNQAFQLWVEQWAAECLRVLKPGGHLLAFGGTRTWHRLAVAVEDAGFEVRDSLAWLYGSGFPKSMDVSKAIDKRRDWSLVERLAGEIRRARADAGLSLAEIGQATLAATGGTYGKWYHRGGHMFFETGRSLPSRPEWEQLRHVLPIAPEFAEVYDEAEREVIGVKKGAMSGWSMDGTTQFVDRDVTAPATDAAREWEGWGTALKPAFEPIVMARKPLAGTVAANVLEHGTGALNIDACRVGSTVETWPKTRARPDNTRDMHHDYTGGGSHTVETGPAPAGRWPANVMLDESQAAALDRQSGVLANAGNKPGSRRTGRADGDAHERTSQVPTYPGGPSVVYDDKGGASRFFYVAKAGRRERPEVDGVKHPTVKPLALMRHLCRLVTPPGGVILEPFAGSGTTVEAAMLEGFDVVGIEREADYLPLIGARVQRALEARAREARETEVRLF